MVASTSSLILKTLSDTSFAATVIVVAVASLVYEDVKTQVFASNESQLIAVGTWNVKSDSVRVNVTVPVEFIAAAEIS